MTQAVARTAHAPLRPYLQSRRENAPPMNHVELRRTGERSLSFRGRLYRSNRSTPRDGRMWEFRLYEVEGGGYAVGFRFRSESPAEPDWSRSCFSASPLGVSEWLSEVDPLPPYPVCAGDGAAVQILQCEFMDAVSRLLGGLPEFSERVGGGN